MSSGRRAAAIPEGTCAKKGFAPFGAPIAQHSDLIESGAGSAAGLVPATRTF